MFATPLLSTDDKLVIMPLTYINSTDFFRSYQDSEFVKKESIEVPFPSHTLNALSSSDIEDYLIEDVMNAHDYFGYHDYDKWRRVTTRRWISSELNELRHRIISEWIVNYSDIAIIVRLNNQHDIFPVSYNCIDNDLFWHNVGNEAGDLSSIRVNEFISVVRQPSQTGTIVDKFIDYILDNWENEHLQQSIKKGYCSNRVITAIHFGIRLCKDPEHASLKRISPLSKVKMVITVWRTIGRVLTLPSTMTNEFNYNRLSQWMEYHTYINFDLVNNIATGIALSGNLSLLKAYICYINKNVINDRPTTINMRRIIVAILMRGTDEMVDYIKSSGAIDSSLLDQDSINRIVNRYSSKNLNSDGIINMIDNGEVISKVMWSLLKKYGLFKYGILQCIQVNNIESLRTLPLTTIYYNRSLVARINELIDGDSL